LTNVSGTYAEKRPWAFLAIAVAWLCAIILFDLSTASEGTSVLREFGPVELSSALFYAYAAGTWLWIRPGDTWKSSWQIPAVMFLMMGREFDLDKKITSVGLLKSQLYFTNSAPLLERVLGVLVVAFVGAIVLRLLLINGPTFVKGLKSRSLWAWCVLSAVAFGVISKSIDGIGRKLAPFGISVDPLVEAKFIYFEEFLELGIPLLFLAASIASSTTRPDLKPLGEARK
jgi:hypothetical protein